MEKKVLLITASLSLKNIFSREELKDYEAVHVSTTKEDALDFVSSENSKPNIMIVVEGTPSSEGTSTEGLIMELRERCPKGRIIFLTGEVVLTDNVKAEMLNQLVRAGVYDIIMGSKPTATDLINHILHPSAYEDVKYLVRETSNTRSQKEGVIKNLISCYSVKPGSGKSFLAYNLAVAIAKFGQPKPNGQMPRVALIDGDLTSLSIGAFIHVENTRYNMREALHYASQVIDEQGKQIGSKEGLEEAKKEIRKCFIKHPKVDNLYAMVATNIELGDRVGINPHQFYFMMQCIYGAFDVVIADMNSSLEHSTTGPLFALSNRIYFLVDPDFNNIRNNIRYQQDLVALGVNSKTRYIMNKYISPTAQLQFSEKLDYSIGEIRNAGIDIVGVIPLEDPIVMNNRAMSGDPLVLDRSQATSATRKAILKIANETWKISERAVKDFEKPEEVPKKSAGNVLEMPKKGFKSLLRGVFGKKEESK